MSSITISTSSSSSSSRGSSSSCYFNGFGIKSIQESSRASWFQITKLESSRIKIQNAPFYVTAKKEHKLLFSMNGDTSYCKYADELLRVQGHERKSQNWRLFIHSSKLSLKSAFKIERTYHPSALPTLRT
jgi:hypothetical protein